MSPIYVPHIKYQLDSELFTYLWTFPQLDQKEAIKMQAMKRIVKSDTAEITIKIPEEFKGKEIEIIILPFESTKNIFTKVSKKERLKGLFSVSKGVLPADYKFDREEAHER